MSIKTWIANRHFNDRETMGCKGYPIEEADPNVVLLKAVEDLMEEGWMPLGGVSIACDPDGAIVYCQAMVLPE